MMYDFIPFFNISTKFLAENSQMDCISATKKKLSPGIDFSQGLPDNIRRINFHLNRSISTPRALHAAVSLQQTNEGSCGLPK